MAIAVSNSVVSTKNQLSSGSYLKSLDQGVTKLSLGQSHVCMHTSKRRPSIQAAYSDGRSGDAGGAFIGGFVLGGLIVGTLGVVYAPQISKALAGTKTKLPRLPSFIFDEENALGKTRAKLGQKIAVLSETIDSISSELKANDAPKKSRSKPRSRSRDEYDYDSPENGDIGYIPPCGEAVAYE